jgi:hypothetical protein
MLIGREQQHRSDNAVAAKAIYIANEQVTNAQAANRVAPPKSNGKN